MKKELYIHWLENMIEGCVDLGGLEKEKAIYQHCLKKARKLEIKRTTHKSNDSNFCKCDLPRSSFELDNGEICCCTCEKEINK